MNPILVHALEKALIVKQQRLLTTRSPSSREVIHRDLKRLKHLIDEFKAKPL